MNKQQYRTNLNCEKCVAAVRPYLDGDASISRWSVDTDDPSKVLTVEGESISEANVADLVSRAGFRVLGSISDDEPVAALDDPSFLETYQPLLLILAYLVGVVSLVEFTAGSFSGMRSMQHFMGGFFLAFSFFKLLNLRGFVDAFQTYDVVARPVRAYGYAYPFIEVALGIAYLTGLAPVATNCVTLVVMLVGILGVSQALIQRRKIQCACLGTVFNLPMSKVTFIEDGVMAAMAAAMIGNLLAT